MPLIEILAPDLEVNLYIGEYLRNLLGTFRIQTDLDIKHVLARLLQHQHNIESSATTQPHQEHFHGPNAQISTTMLRGTIHDHRVTTAGFTNKAHMIKPSYSCVQSYLSSCPKPATRSGADFIEEFKNTADQCLTLDKNNLDGQPGPTRFLRKL